MTARAAWTALLLVALPGSLLGQATHPAMNEPDQFAWEIFVKINRPASNGSNDVVWETWADNADTFPALALPGRPPSWPSGRPRAKRLQSSRQMVIAETTRARLLQTAPRITAGATMEVRRNRPAFDFIVANDLWHADGIADAFQAGRSISFPPEAIEIKATWKRIDEAERAAYHWNHDDSGTLFGLTALHITTKDVPNWFWATFEHVDNSDLGRDQPCRDAFGATELGNCASEPSEPLKALMTNAGLAPYWLNYRLAGSQTDFTDATGRSTTLGNSEIEGAFMLTSSCITCHSKAAVLADGSFLPVFKSFNPIEGDVGTPNPNWFFHPGGAKRALQLDFVWSFLEAHPLTSLPGRTAELVHQDTAPPLSKQQLFEAGAAAANFAQALAGDDDRELVRVFTESLRMSHAPGGALRRWPHAVVPEMTELSGLGDVSGSEVLKNRAAMIRTYDVRARIVGGSETSAFPDCVAVGAPGQWCCTGTLIAPDAVLTAGHCDEGGCSARVFIGADTKQPQAGVTVGVRTVVRHPEYNPLTLKNDLAILILESGVAIDPRAIATSAEIDLATDVRAVGFGRTNFSGTVGYGHKREVDLPIAASLCSANGVDRYGCHLGLELVAGEPFLDRDTCNGDSGGPAYVWVYNQWKLAGATSRPTNESIRACGDGGTYVRVDKYRTWIESVLADH